MATLHSQSLEALPRRLKALGHISGLDSQLTSELLNSIDLVVQLSRDPIRKVEAIAVLGRNSVDLELVPLEI